MNESAVMHEPESKYCFATDKNTVCLRLRISKSDAPEKVEVIYGGKYTYALKQFAAEMKRVSGGRLFDYYTVKLKLDDVRFVYVFKITENGKTYYYSEDGLTEKFDYQLSYYNCFQYAYINECDIIKPIKWMQNAVFYQIFIERFNIGDKDKDLSYINLKWGDIPDPKSFAGGDLKGVTQKLNYLYSLGVNTIYLTPVFKSVSNHKYDISDYYTVDEHFGGKAALKELVETAHSMGMRVVLDAVFNHCSENLDKFQDVKKNGRKSKYYDWFIIESDKPFKYECFSSCTYMPKLNTSNPEVRKYLCDISTYWIKELDIDGWRLDVSDEVSHEFWRDMRRAVKGVKSDALLLGENWHDANQYLRGDQFDAIMNYAFTKACLDYFAFGEFNAGRFADKLNELLMRNTDTVNGMMLNLLDSHDTDRFLTRVKGKVDKLESAVALLFFYTGAPCIYYGTENAMEGGYDPDCRRTFDWSQENKDTHLKGLIKFLAGLKKTDDFAQAELEIKSCGDLVIAKRRGDKKTYTLILNGGGDAAVNVTDPAICLNYSGNKLFKDGFLIEIKDKEETQ
ncbi:MAG: glycoside hydrolase family 13 protein [Clostridia bacterium]|nr:glycoside hydrolase family 13 protein [Clostridia bacterium]